MRMVFSSVLTSSVVIAFLPFFLSVCHGKSQAFCDFQESFISPIGRLFSYLKNFRNLFLLSLNHLNRTVSDLLYKIFSKNKRPWPQTNYRRYLVRIVWQSRSPGYFVNSLVWVYARLLPLVFSHSQNTFLRDMKLFGLFVLLFYQIGRYFSRGSAVSKPL